jgi:hypothetical protein
MQAHGGCGRAGTWRLRPCRRIAGAAVQAHGGCGWCIVHDGCGCAGWNAWRLEDGGAGPGLAERMRAVLERSFGAGPVGLYAADMAGGEQQSPSRRRAQGTCTADVEAGRARMDGELSVGGADSDDEFGEFEEAGQGGVHGVAGGAASGSGDAGDGSGGAGDGVLLEAWTAFLRETRAQVPGLPTPIRHAAQAPGPDRFRLQRLPMPSTSRSSSILRAAPFPSPPSLSSGARVQALPEVHLPRPIPSPVGCAAATCARSSAPPPSGPAAPHTRVTLPHFAQRQRPCTGTRPPGPVLSRVGPGPRPGTRAKARDPVGGG